MFSELFGLQQFSQGTGLFVLFGTSIPDGSFSGDRRFDDTNIGSCQVQLDVIGKIDDPADLHLIRCKLIAATEGPQLTLVRVHRRQSCGVSAEAWLPSHGAPDPSRPQDCF